MACSRPRRCGPHGSTICASRACSARSTAGWPACTSTRWTSDRPTTLFYLDPPYWGCESYYGKGLFARADFARLAATLRAIKGRFIMSLNDTPGVRATFKGFRIETVPVTYRVRGVKDVQELIITGRA